MQELQLNQNSQHTQIPAMYWEEKDKGKEKKKDLSEENQNNTETGSWENSYSTNIRPEPPYILLSHATENGMAIQNDKTSETTNHVSLVENRGMCDTLCQYTILISDWISCGIPVTAVWHQAISHLDKGALPREILKIKNNPSKPVNIILILNPDVFIDIETDPEAFHEYYQNLAPTREEQEQCLKEINT
ncbi:hypothetical protein G9A89_016197 [Geosiphon pyriformis]|nr:hypothetical protein G9A89_016197 [Geosiphon pyriformis]